MLKSQLIGILNSDIWENGDEEFILIECDGARYSVGDKEFEVSKGKAYEVIYRERGGLFIGIF